jgi:hypothetical protein
MPQLPGMQGEVFFQDVDTPLPEVAWEDGDIDDEAPAADDVIHMLGFDPDEFDDGDDEESGLEIRDAGQPMSAATTQAAAPQDEFEAMFAEMLSEFDRLAEKHFAEGDPKGHWVTTEEGNRLFVKDGQLHTSPTGEPVKTAKNPESSETSHKIPESSSTGVDSNPESATIQPSQPGKPPEGQEGKKVETAKDKIPRDFKVEKAKWLATPLEILRNSEDVSPYRVSPIHEVRDRGKLHTLVQSMKESGWEGDPVLAIKNGEEDFQAWNASHRIAAAKQAGLDDIPVVAIEREDFLEAAEVAGYNEEQAESLLENQEDDEDRLKILKELGFNVAAEIMRREVENNE